MNEKTIKLVQYIRYGILLAGIGAFAISSYAHSAPKEFTVTPPDIEEFWPPDMVPHPGPPHSPPKKDEMS